MPPAPKRLEEKREAATKILGLGAKIIHAFDIPATTKVIKELEIISVLFSYKEYFILFCLLTLSALSVKAFEGLTPDLWAVHQGRLI